MRKYCTLSLLVFAVACNDDLTAGVADDGGGIDAPMNLDGGGGDLSVPDGGVLVRSPDGGTRVCYITPCAGHVYQCGDCLDNDGDGLIDSDDPECLNQCHNTEEGLDPLIPGGNKAPCKQTCFFDASSGGGNNDCFWDHRCDPHEKAPSYSPEGVECAYDPKVNIPGTSKSCAQLQAAQSTTCHGVCDPLTPNGCDCFGCCALQQVTDPMKPPTEGIWLGSKDNAGAPSCTLAKLSDPTACHACQIVQSCFKPCGECQLCFGKTTLPAKCLMSGGADGGTGNRDGGTGNRDGGTGGTCPSTLCPGGIACAPATSGLDCPACPAQWYCISGCCTPPLG